MQFISGRATRRLFEGIRKGWLVDLWLSAAQAMALYGLLDALMEDQPPFLTPDDRAAIEVFLPRLSEAAASGTHKWRFLQAHREDWTVELPMTPFEARALSAVVGAVYAGTPLPDVDTHVIKRLRDRLRREMLSREEDME